MYVCVRDKLEQSAHAVKHQTILAPESRKSVSVQKVPQTNQMVLEGS